MQIVTTRKELISAFKSDSYDGPSVGFVPTMGALHKGHISLIEKAASENDMVVASIFVNPAQFNDPNDLKNYPRTPEKDLEILRAAGCDLVFHPAQEEVYDGREVRIPDPGQMAQIMEGASRPGHFKGVMMVVRRLFELIQPTSAYFGEKDYQQLAIIRFMVKELGIQVNIKGCPTIRESDGLAMSSRNVFLTPEERKKASVIYDGLSAAAQTFRRSGTPEARRQFMNAVEGTGIFRVEYLQIADQETLMPSEVYQESQEYRIFTAVRCSHTRLIDNIAV
jgi:pantoate--beta-alanine ligase